MAPVKAVTDVSEMMSTAVLDPLFVCALPGSYIGLAENQLWYMTSGAQTIAMLATMSDWGEAQVCGDHSDAGWWRIRQLDVWKIIACCYPKTYPCHSNHWAPKLSCASVLLPSLYMSSSGLFLEHGTLGPHLALLHFDDLVSKRRRDLFKRLVPRLTVGVSLDLSQA